MADGGNGDTCRKTAVPTADCRTREAKCGAAGSSDNNQEVAHRAVRGGEESVERNFDPIQRFISLCPSEKCVSSSEEMSNAY